MDPNINFALFVDCVLDIVLAIIGISDFSRDLFWLLFSSLDGDLEFVATGFTVLLHLVTSLNDELNRFIEGTFSHETGAITEGLLRLGVKEERELSVGGGQIIARER